MIRVLIADDHTLVRQGIRMLLETQPDLQVVGEASDGLEAIRMSNELKPDLVLMDIAMPTLDGLAATQELKRLQPNTHVLALTMYEDENYFFKVLAAGAGGYVLKRAAASDLITAIHVVSQGEVFLYPAIAKKLVGDYLARFKSSDAEAGEALSALTPREQEVLALIADGLSNREIAERLVLSLSTVQSHYAHIGRKLNLHNRTELVKYAIRRGLLNTPL